MDATEQITENVLRDPEISKSLDTIIKIAADEYIKKIYILEGQLKDKKFELDELDTEYNSQRVLLQSYEEEIRELQYRNEELKLENEELVEKVDRVEEGLIKQETDTEKLNFKYSTQVENLTKLQSKDKENEKRILELVQMLQRKELELSNYREEYSKFKDKVDRMESFANVKDRMAKQMQASFILLNETIEKSKKSIRDKDVEISRLQRVVHEQQIRM